MGTKHRHIKFIWRQILKNYKLVYNPSLYNNLGDTILALHKNAYHIIKPLHVPIPTVSRHRPPNTQDWLRDTRHRGLPPTTPYQIRNLNIPGHPTLAPHPTNNRSPQHIGTPRRKPTSHPFTPSRIILQTPRGPFYGHTTHTRRRPTHTYLHPN